MKYTLMIFSRRGLTDTIIAEHTNISKSLALKIVGEYLNSYPSLKVILRRNDNA